MSILTPSSIITNSTSGNHNHHHHQYKQPPHQQQPYEGTNSTEVLTELKDKKRKASSQPKDYDNNANHVNRKNACLGAGYETKHGPTKIGDDGQNNIVMKSIFIEKIKSSAVSDMTSSHQGSSSATYQELDDAKNRIEKKNSLGTEKMGEDCMCSKAAVGR